MSICTRNLHLAKLYINNNSLRISIIYKIYKYNTIYIMELNLP